MPNLDIIYSGGGYELVIENVGAVALVDDEAVVSTLANAMADGLPAVIENAEFIFAGSPTGEEIASIFSDTTTLSLEADVIFDAVAAGAASLLEALTAAGEALVAALV